MGRVSWKWVTKPVEDLEVPVDVVHRLDEVLLLGGQGGQPPVDAPIEERLDLPGLLLEEAGGREAGVEDEGLVVQGPGPLFHFRGKRHGGHQFSSWLDGVRGDAALEC
jgi:hypothetical protein